MDYEKIIADLGGPSEVARLCEVEPQAVSQWFGINPKTGVKREIPKARLMFLKAVRPDIFATEDATPAPSAAAPPAPAASDTAPTEGKHTAPVTQPTDDPNDVLPPEHQRDRRDPNHQTRRVSARSGAEAMRIENQSKASLAEGEQPVLVLDHKHKGG